MRKLLSLSLAFLLALATPALAIIAQGNNGAPATLTLTSGFTSAGTFTSATPKTCATITLKPGNWVVWGIAQFAPSGTMTVLQGAINTTTNTLPGTVDESWFLDQFSTTVNQIRPFGAKVYTVTVDTPVYAVANVTWTGTSVTVSCSISAHSLP